MDKKDISQFKLERQKTLDDVNDRIQTFTNKASRDEWISNRISLLNEKINKRPDRQPQKEGNITMKQHLQNMKKELEEEPEKFVERVVGRLQEEKQRLEIQIEELDGDGDILY